MKAIQTAFQHAVQRMGDPLLPETDFGPLAGQLHLHFDRVIMFLRQSNEERIEGLVGGERQRDEEMFVQPTVFLGLDLKSKLWTDQTRYLVQSSLPRHSRQRRKLSSSQMALNTDWVVSVPF